jgi:hypothetical protein
MNTFKKITYKHTNNVIPPFLHNSINLTSINDFPSLNKKTSIDNNISDNLNFIDATNKKVEINKQEDDSGLCTIYYDKELKKIITHNFPKKMYRDDDEDDDDDDDLDTKSNFFIDEPTNTHNPHNIKYPELHHGMNKAIRNIMERRDKFIDQYGTDEFIRDYLPKDSTYLYSRYYYRNKYMNNYNYKNRVNNMINRVITCDNNAVYSRNESDLTQYDVIEVDIDPELLTIDDDIDLDDIDDEDEIE